MKFGIQLYGILKDRRTDIMETLKELRTSGFSRIEPCISLEPIPGMEHVIWPEAWFRSHAWDIRETGLEVVSAHIFTENPAVSARRLKRLAEDLGIRQFVVKTPQDISGESLQQTAMTYMYTAEILAEAGAELLLHNEAADIKARIHGQTVYEHLLSLCLGKVGAQVDTGWVYAAGEDPEALLRRIGPLVRSLHYKEFRMENGTPVQTMIGHGDTDQAACFQFARAMGIPQIIDQDEFDGNPMEECIESLKAIMKLGQFREHTVSYLNILDTATGEIQTLRRFGRVIEAPVWLKGENRILFNADGLVYSYDLEMKKETLIPTGICDNCNNDHVVSPDEKYLAVSHSAKETPWASQVYILPLEGGEPRLVTEKAPSYLHGWSPDGGELSYCAFREHDGKINADIYVIPAKGGEEIRLTHEGFNDGPEYSPDGKHIWFISTRTGLMQIWRMNRDGSEQTQMTFTERNNWFCHVSPDGQKITYLSYRKEDLELGEHLPNMQVQLWLMNADGSDPHPAASFFGGQGSINVNSWAKDSRHLAFISYELL